MVGEVGDVRLIPVHVADIEVGRGGAGKTGRRAHRRRAGPDDRPGRQVLDPHPVAAVRASYRLVRGRRQRHRLTRREHRLVHRQRHRPRRPSEGLRVRHEGVHPRLKSVAAPRVKNRGARARQPGGARPHRGVRREVPDGQDTGAGL